MDLNSWGMYPKSSNKVFTSKNENSIKEFVRIDAR